MSAIKNSETLGNKVSKVFIFLKKGLSNNPKSTGKKTIKKEDFISLETSILIFSFVKKRIKNGVKITENIVDINVHKIERATSALHKYAIKLDAVPPGQLPKIIIPNAYSEEKKF